MRFSFAQTDPFGFIGATVLMLPASARLFLCKHPMNMRKSFEGLGSMIEELFPGELFSGAFFIFLNRSKDHMKVMFWDQDGFVIWYKRLQKGTFSQIGKDDSMSRREFLMLLEGITPKKVRPCISL